MKAVILSLAVLAALAAAPVNAGPNEPSCTGTKCPDKGEDKGR